MYGNIGLTDLDNIVRSRLILENIESSENFGCPPENDGCIQLAVGIINAADVFRKAPEVFFLLFAIFNE